MTQDWKQRWKNRKRRISRRIELARLRRIRKKQTPRYTCCKNCGTTLEGMYCHRCGQYALDSEQPFWKYVRQYFENVYQFDTKIGRTLWYMFTRPGFLTAEFNAGKINSYVHPFRLYMCISVVFFTFFFMAAGSMMGKINAFNDGNLTPALVNRMEREGAKPDTTVYLYHAAQLAEVLQLRYHVEDPARYLSYQLVDQPYGLARATLPRLLYDSCLVSVPLADADWKHICSIRRLEKPDIENWRDGIDHGPENLQAILSFPIDSLHTRTAAGQDSLVLRPSAVYDWGKDLGDEQQILSNDLFSNSIMGQLSKWTPLYLMFLLPFFAVLLKLFYRKKRMPYMWHFVHATHLNTVFLVLLPVPLVPMFLYGVDSLMAARDVLDPLRLNLLRAAVAFFPVGMFLYMLVSFHTVYRQGWGKTLLKALLFMGTFTLSAMFIGCVLLLWLLVIVGEDFDFII